MLVNIGFWFGQFSHHVVAFVLNPLTSPPVIHYVVCPTLRRTAGHPLSPSLLHGACHSFSNNFTQPSSLASWNNSTQVEVTAHFFFVRTRVVNYITDPILPKRANEGIQNEVVPQFPVNMSSILFNLN